MKRSPLKRKSELRSHTELKRAKPMSARPRKPSKVNAAYTKELRQYVAERDEWCQVCGSRGDQVHHVIPRGRYKVHPERYLLNSVHDERNLMWICWKCHQKATDDNAELERVILIQERRFGKLRKEFA